MRFPDFGELVGDDLSPEEAARLRRVHDLLVAAGPPPELPPQLEAPPEPPRASVVNLLTRRRGKAGLLLAAALAAAAFGGGYLVGSGGGDGTSKSFATKRVVQLHGAGAAKAAAIVVRIGKHDSTGNLPMLVTVEGLPHLSHSGYYTLWMTKHGKRLVPCGSFNVNGGNAQTTVRMSVGYSLGRFDGFAVTRYHHKGHTETPVASAALT